MSAEDDRNPESEVASQYPRGRIDDHTDAQPGALSVDGHAADGQPSGAASSRRRSRAPTTAHRIRRSTRSQHRDAPQPKDLYEVGTAADVLRMFSLPDGQRQVIVQGRRRFELGEFIETDPVLIARVTMVEEAVPETKEFEARILNLRQEAARALASIPGTD